jgi:hypothetical protein
MGASRVGPHARREYLAQMRERYEQAKPAAKGSLLDDICTLTGYHRKAVIRLLGRPAATRPRRPRGRQLAYGPAVGVALRAIWIAAGYPWSVRLKALLPAWVPWARRRLRLTAATEQALLRISARQIDRRRQADKRMLRTRIYGRTKPGTLLKHHIPVQTARWNVQEPGFTEIDLVSHSGACADGEFLHSLNVTDIHTTWVETQAVLGKSQERVRQALATISDAWPFALRGIDSDNGSEFINDHLYRYCRARDIQFTRGRPYKKDDNAHIEQNNWTHVRKVVGSDRYDSTRALAALNALYADLRLLQNLWLPSVKLVTKTRIGSRLRRVYDPPQTPLDRVRACPTADAAKVAALTQLHATLDPFVLAARLEAQPQRLYALASGRPGDPAVVLPAAAASRLPPRRKDPRRFLDHGRKPREHR